MKVIDIPLELIDEDNMQPRTNFEEISITELAESIRQVGLLNPIKVRPIQDGRYKIIFGNRRYKACVKLQLVEIPCIISDNEDEIDVFLEQLTENIQREGFTPIEEALAFKKMVDEYNWSKKMLAGQLGKTERYIARKLDLLTFGTSVQKIIHSGTNIVQNSLTEDQVLKLKKIPIEYRDHLAIKISQEQISVDDAGKIAEFFVDKSIASDMKEKLLSMKCNSMIGLWAEKQIANTTLSEDNDYKNKELSIAQNDTKPITQEQKLIEDYFYKVSPIEEKLDHLQMRIPTYHPFAYNLIQEVDEIPLDKREELYDSICTLLDTLNNHYADWSNIKQILERKKDFKKGIKLIK